MWENDGRRLDHKTLEDRRVRAVRQILDGSVQVPDVADALGLRRSTVYAWVKTCKGQGPEALAAKPIPGRPRKLSDEQTRTVYSILRGEDPRQLGFEFALWTRWMVCDLLHRLFGVALTEQSVGRMLHRLGMSPQRPGGCLRAGPGGGSAVEDRHLPGYPHRGCAGWRDDLRRR